MENQKILNLSEHFYSIQAEGVTTGYPAYFIRFKNCNLSCGISAKHLQEIKNAGKGNTPPGDFIGDLHKEGSATWTCDTAPVWLFGDKVNYQDLVDKWKQENILEWIKEGRVHLIWSGGEPTIPKLQKDIVSFLEWFDEKLVYNEIETNGTFYIEDGLFKNLNQINCSVKLSNSGMAIKKRIIPAALRRIMEHPNYWFKFVISKEKDLEEINRDFIEPFQIPWNKVLMMPGLDDQSKFHERTLFVYEMAKKYGFIGMQRMHISAWSCTTGV